MPAKAAAKKTTKPKAVKTKPKTAPKTIFKYFAPEAGEVCLAGTFNDWRDKEIFLKKDKNGYWNGALALGEGRYEYRYIVDGNWANDQDQMECVPNPFGTWNSVIQIQV